MTSDRGAVLQIEFDRKRIAGYPDTRDEVGDRKSTFWKIRRLIESAMYDTITNGGTFVLVASSDTLTVVQRPDVEPLSSDDDADPAATP